MLIPILRSGALYLLWRRHIRRRAFGLIVTAALILAVNLIHSEALAFFSATERLDLAPLAFYFRWCAWLIAGIGYLWFVERKLAKDAQQNRSKTNKDLNKSKDSIPAKPVEQHDGFDALRHNAPLRSRAEILMEQKRREKSDDA
ncbi:Uncharacterised protein [Zhongshania aliphaticivorans]|uniref:Uncharacterized protein n=1 Tax=Zhongshania aliphaticivorans TaxID=1470434 RepID=A0A5S9N8U3_9GAMM|nr:hypothetical protein [Zhongshania aliphaticivorans]CAA0080618.1 Uncharacterised protein [Zhongshania aliphaticivorans]CAA0085626.1 Uncharacterised protein [Zhongshania aliphaticivorans]